MQSVRVKIYKENPIEKTKKSLFGLNVQLLFSSVIIYKKIQLTKKSRGMKFTKKIRLKKKTKNEKKSDFLV